MNHHELMVGRVKLRVSTAREEHAGCSNCGRMEIKGLKEQTLLNGPLVVIEAPDATIRLCMVCRPRVGWPMLGFNVGA